MHAEGERKILPREAVRCRWCLDLDLGLKGIVGFGKWGSRGRGDQLVCGGFRLMRCGPDLELAVVKRNIGVMLENSRQVSSLTSVEKGKGTTLTLCTLNISVRTPASHVARRPKSTFSLTGSVGSRQ